MPDMHDMYDVIIVGAGPAGCRTAALVANRGFRVLVLEEHEEIGKPVQCAGLVSWRLRQLLTDLQSEIIINKVDRAKFFSPKKQFELKSKKPVYVIDRTKLDKFLYGKAKKAEFITGAKFRGYKKVNDGLEVRAGKQTFKTKLLVGADGPNSTVAAQAKLVQPKNKLVGIQATVDGEFDPGAVELWFGSRVSPDFFGWVIPLNSRVARVGIAARTDCREYFSRLIWKRIGRLVKPDVAGVINYGLMDTATERVMLVGDAAAQVKPLSGGGVVYGLMGAGHCARTCIKSLREERFDSEFLMKEYDAEWKEKLEKPIKRGLRYSQIIHKSDWRMNLLFTIARRTRFILRHFDMDLL